jgi:hypothetical protein
MATLAGFGNNQSPYLHDKKVSHLTNADWRMPVRQRFQAVNKQ